MSALPQTLPLPLPVKCHLYTQAHHPQVLDLVLFLSSHAPPQSLGLQGVVLEGPSPTKGLGVNPGPVQ